MKTRTTHKVVSVLKSDLVKDLVEYGEEGKYELEKVGVSPDAVHFTLRRLPPPPPKPPEPDAAEDLDAAEEIPL